MKPSDSETHAAKDPFAPRYWAFLSYSHADEAWAAWLHRRLETYKVPKALVGTPSEDGTFTRPARLMPVFRDREELSASHSLSEHIGAALRESRNLIVLCSPRSARSRWVNEEIRLFQALGRQTRIFCLIVDGDPSGEAGVDQCMPEALRLQGEQHVEPLAADVRPGKDHRKNASLKLMAGIIGVRFDALRQREQERRFRQLAAGSAVLGAAFLGAAGLAYYAFDQRDRALEARRSAVDARIAEKQARDLAEKKRGEADRAAADARAAEQVAIAAKKDAEEKTQQAEAAERRTRVALQDATLRRLALESKAMFDGARAGGQLTAVRLALAGHAIEPRSDQFGTLQAAIESGDGSLRAWDVPGGPLNAVGFSADGRVIVSAGADSRLRFWSADTGTPIGEPVQNKDLVVSLTLSADGQRVVTADVGGHVRQWDLRTHAMTASADAPPARFGNAWLHHIAASPTGKQWATAASDSANGLALWDVDGRSTSTRLLKGHAGAAKGVAFSADGLRLASGGEDKTIRLWDTQTGLPMGAPISGHGGPVTSVAFSPDGQTIVSGSHDQTVRLWRVVDGKFVDLRMEHPGFGAGCVAFSPDGERVASAGQDGSIRVWDAHTGRALAAPLKGHRGWIHDLAFSPDGQRLVSAGDDGTVRLWDGHGAAHGTLVVEHAAAVTSVSFAREAAGHRLAAADNSGAVLQWDADSGRAIGTSIQMPPMGVSSVAFGPDGRRIATAGSDGALRLWDADSGRSLLPPLRGHRFLAHAVDFSGDGRWLVSGDEEGELIVWDARSGAVLRRLERQRGPVWSVKFSADATLIAASGGKGMLTVFDARSGRTLATARHDPNMAFHALAFSPDGRQVAVADWTQQAVHLFDARTARMLDRPFIGHTFIVNAVAFSPDGRFIASGSTDGTVRLWDADSGEPVGAPLPDTGGVQSLAFSADGLRLAGASLDHKVRVWDAPASWPTLLCQRLTRNLSLSEWRHHIGEALPYRKQCAGLPVPRD